MRACRGTHEGATHAGMRACAATARSRCGKKEQARICRVGEVSVAAPVDDRVTRPFWAGARCDERDMPLVVDVGDGHPPGLCRANEEQAAGLQPVDVVDTRS